MEEILDNLAERIARKLAKCLATPTEPELVDQHHSALGPRKHCAIVRRRRRMNLGGAFHVNDLFLLSRAAYLEELERASALPPAAARAEASTDEDAAYRQLMTRIGK